MNAIVYDIVLTAREVDIPDTCPNPKCGADFRNRKDNFLVIEELKTSYERAFIVSAKDEPELIIDYVVSFDKKGDDLGRVAYRCHNCNYMLAQGKREERP